ncbi:MAG: ABC transporter permease [Mediterranea sp.]|jgi:ABC-2 type transport system permease protein|nr:ABC transporter permease [Mediterranea sp.]
MKPFTAFILKEFRHILRDRRTMLILLAMPVVEIILFGFAISTEVKNIRVAVLDPSRDAVTRRITDRLDANRYFTVRYTAGTPAEVDRLFLQSKIDLAVIFGNRFAGRLQTGEAELLLVADATDPNMAVLQTSYAAQAIRDELQVPGITPPPGMIGVTHHLLYNPQVKSAANFVPGVMGLIMMLICAMMTSISIVREKETGTMEILLTSPVRPIIVILSKVAPYFVLSIINLATILALSVYVLEVPIAGSLFQLIAVSFLFIFTALALGILISTIAKTQVAAMLGAGLTLMMPTMLLSGMIFPIENMPPVLQYLSSLIPARWYIGLVKHIMIQGAPVATAAKPVAVLVLMAIVLTAASLKKYKNKPE